MPALVEIDLPASIAWLGRVADRDSTLAAQPVARIEATFAGLTGESHSGATRPACTRTRQVHPVGTEIRNVRQLSIVSQEELARVAALMDVEDLDPAWIGAQMMVRGIPDFSHVPPGTRLQTGAGTTLTVDMQNYPCQLPAPVIEPHRPGAGGRFKRAAQGMRGVTAWVERAGPLEVGDALRLFVPDQRAWEGPRPAAAS